MYFMERYSNEWFLLTDFFFIIHPASFISADISLKPRFIHIANGCGHMLSKARILYTAQWQTFCKGDNCVRQGWVDIQKCVCKSIFPYIMSRHNVWWNNAYKNIHIQCNKVHKTFVMLWDIWVVFLIHSKIGGLIININVEDSDKCSFIWQKNEKRN